MPPEESLAFARMIKEQHCYACPSILAEFAKYDARQEGTFMNINHKGKQVDIGYERFLGPEILFNPEIAGLEGKPLSDLLDDCIQACPIDARRSLYNNVVLSGGTTLFRDLNKRIQRDLRVIVEDRLQRSLKNTKEIVNKADPIQVNVHSHTNQKYAVWSGGSLFASMPQFGSYCVTKAQYEEYGPSICRQSRVFANLLV